MQSLCGTWFGTGALNGCRGRRESNADSDGGWGATVTVESTVPEGHQSLSGRLAKDRYEDAAVVIDRHGMRFREAKGPRPSGRAGFFEALGGSSSRIHVSVFDQGDIAEPSKRASSNAPGPGHRERELGRGAADRKFARAQSEEVDDDVVSIASTASFRRRDHVLDCATSQKQGSTRRLNHGDNLAEVENWLRTVPASSLTVQDGTAGQKDRSRVYKMPPVATRNKADTILEQYDGYDIGSMLVKVGRLGRGSGGTVWQATFDNGRHRVPVAVKEVLVAAEEEEKREMVVHEMKTLYQIQHPCIVNCYKVFLSNSIFSMVMELVNGGSLLDLMKAAPEVIPQDAVGAVCSSVLHALSHLHDENMIMHRDVKPGNILVSVDGEVKLADLGVCTRPGEESTTKWVGTATYMSPERLMGDEYTNAADVWSAGLVVAEAVMGMYPYVKHTKGGSLEFWDLLDMLTSGPSTASILTEANCGASEDLIDFVAATTNRDASLRPRASQALAHPWIANADPASQQSSLAAWARGVRNALPQDSEKDLVRNMCGLSVCGAPSEDAWQRSTGGGGEMPWSGVVDSINFSLWGV